ncbi:hypothetical protein Gbem_2140 [Citrifermentans bemidjiense Bem]|uniref:Uncharacterized protein n=1 Tax=Citrifermentans bemidjiense (strain ATCC BAA-1014 / DSM 16622 / JCM 12645 / Bem) TaxID=404380 RepID=B5EDF7_CITBB|nr:hypothetical protein [Citrifermentans bemidjiense]ACH39153.1 hypothetical protein Gbem_2140 [Citrifermentans bemidjiense Bem]
MAKKECFHLSRGGSCELPSCDYKRVELQIVDWTGCNGNGRDESFDVSTWTPEQFAAHHAFVNLTAGTPTAFDKELEGISEPPLRLFHLLHSLFGSEGVKRVYSLPTIRNYRRRLRDAGFDYPSRHVPTGPRKPRAMKDLSMGPSKPRRSSEAAQRAVSNTAL